MKFSALLTGTRHTQLSPSSGDPVTERAPSCFSVWELTKIDTVQVYQHSCHVAAENPGGEDPGAYSRLGREEGLWHVSRAAQLSQSQRPCRVQILCLGTDRIVSILERCGGVTLPIASSRVALYVGPFRVSSWQSVDLPQRVHKDKHNQSWAPPLKAKHLHLRRRLSYLRAPALNGFPWWKPSGLKVSYRAAM